MLSIGLRVLTSKINIFQHLIEIMADFLDDEITTREERFGELEDDCPREKSELHIRMARAAMDEYLKTKTSKKANSKP